MLFLGFFASRKRTEASLEAASGVNRGKGACFLFAIMYTFFVLIFVSFEVSSGSRESWPEVQLFSQA